MKAACEYEEKKKEILAMGLVAEKHQQIVL